MSYKKILDRLFEELQEKEGYAVRNIRLLYKEEVYRMVVSVLDFGKRIEIKGSDDSYFIYVQGVIGMEEEGIVHHKGANNIIKAINRMNENIIKEIVDYPGDGGQKDSLFKKSQLFTVTLPRGLNKEKTKEELEEQMNRILDRYNDYMFLYHHPAFQDEKYLRKAKKIMSLLKKKTLQK